MKNLSKSIFLILSLSFSPLLGALAQCNNYYQVEKGMVWEYQSYNKKDKQTGRQWQKVTDYNGTDNGWKATIASKSFDKKDNLQHEGSVGMECKNGVIEMDISQMVPEESMESFQKMDLKMTTDNLDLPKKLEVGQKLDDGSMKMEGNIPFTIQISIENRKVVGEEDVTTPAGTFHAYKIAYDVHMKTMMEIRTSAEQFYAPGVGMVKSVSYDKKGNMIGYTVLSKFEKP